MKNIHNDPENTTKQLTTTSEFFYTTQNEANKILKIAKNPS